MRGARRHIQVLLLLIVCVSAAHADVIDRLMAVVDGQLITLSDVTAALQFHLVEPPPGTADPVAYTVDRLVERTLVLAEVDRFQPPEPDPIEITIRIDEFERRAGSPAAFDKMLAMTGMTTEACMLKASAVDGQPWPKASKARVWPRRPTPAPPHSFGRFSSRNPASRRSW